MMASVAVTPFTDTLKTGMSWGGLAGATVTVLLTTLDDSVWLLPFVGTPSVTLETRFFHAIAFIVTLEGLALICCLVAIAILKGVSSTGNINAEDLEIKLEAVAVIICWTLAGGFLLRKLRRQRQRQQQQQQAVHQNTEKNSESKNESQDTLIGSSQKPQYASICEEEADNDTFGDCQGSFEDSRHAMASSQSLWTVVTLTTVGFLDEISYFPALVVGNVFTLWELCIGTFIAGLLMLGIQVFLASQCKPIIEFLDNRVPLYGIISLFATILTIKLIWDLTANP